MQYGMVQYNTRQYDTIQGVASKGQSCDLGFIDEDGRSDHYHRRVVVRIANCSSGTPRRCPRW